MEGTGLGSESGKAVGGATQRVGLSPPRDLLEVFVGGALRNGVRRSA